MRNTLAILLGLMLVSGAALANEESATGLDQDQDGLISVEEASADASLADNFADLDVDADGYLSSSELDSAAE